METRGHPWRPAVQSIGGWYLSLYQCDSVEQLRLIELAAGCTASAAAFQARPRGLTSP
jgi:hypothetical protein